MAANRKLNLPDEMKEGFVQLLTQPDHTDIPAFVENVCQALEAKSDATLRPADGNWNPFKAKLSRLLSEFTRVEGDFARERESEAAHPLAPLAGKYDNEPLWDEFLQAMEAYRQEVNKKEASEE